MPQANALSLWQVLSGDLSQRFLSSDNATVALSDLDGGSCLGGRVEELRGRSVLIVASDQLAAALALIELDGIARRIVLWPADLGKEHLPFVIASAKADVVVSDGSANIAECAGLPHVPCSLTMAPATNQELAQNGVWRETVPDSSRGARRTFCASKATPQASTEWILLTSGTTGRPKMVVHTLSSLAGAIPADLKLRDARVWSTFYDIRRYGGLQIFLRAMFTGGSLVLSSAHESTAEFLERAGAHGVSHISGTPSHWRKALMSQGADRIAPRYVRLSGEIADQSILDNLRSCYPNAQVSHAFASTEAGLAFDVGDGLAGFPASVIGQPGSAVEMKVVNGTLRIRSSRVAADYLGDRAGTLKDADGFVDTGDMLELRDERYYFVGRRDGVINVGGQKVHPEEIEGVINRHPRVRMSLVRSRKNALMGALVVADVVLEKDLNAEDEQLKGFKNEIFDMCRGALPRHKVPAAIQFVNQLAVAASGKMVRQHA